MAWTPGEPYKASDGPADGGITITPSDTVVFTKPTRAIYVGVAGDVAVRMVGDKGTLVFKNALAGSLLPVSADMVFATNTSASSIVGII